VAPAEGEHDWIDDPEVPTAQARAYGSISYKVCSVSGCRAIQSADPESTRGVGKRCPWSPPAPAPAPKPVGAYSHDDVVEGKEASKECEIRYNSGKRGTPAGTYHRMASGDYQDASVLCKTCNKVGLTIEELNREPHVL
jgi:hypothetical protein